MKLTTSNATVTNTVVSSRLTIGNNAVVESLTLTVGNVSINSSAIAVGNVSITPAAISTPQLVLGGISFTGGSFGGIFDYQEFTANGTWYNPYANASVNASLTGYEQVLVMAWGAGGGGSTTSGSGRGGGGGACVIGNYALSQLGSTANVIVGLGGAAGAPTGSTGGSSIFANGTSLALTAYGGGGGGNTSSSGGGGGGTLSAGGLNELGGNPLPGNASVAYSTFGGAGALEPAASIFGGGAGRNSGNSSIGFSVYGGGAGCRLDLPGSSVFGGRGGNSSVAPATPAGGGGGGNASTGTGARGEVRVWVIGPGSTTAGAPTYTLTANTTTLYEGSSVLYTVSTTNVVNNTTLYYTLNNSSTATSADFTTAVNGSVVISGGTGTFTLTANNDTDSDNEAFQIDVRTGSSTGSIVASNGSVSVVPVPTWLNEYSNNDTLSTFTFTNIDISGASASSNRYLVLHAIGRTDSGLSGAITSVTVNGSPATVVQPGGDSIYPKAFACIQVPSGSTANVTVVADEPLRQMQLGVWAAYNLSSTTNKTTGYDVNIFADTSAAATISSSLANSDRVFVVGTGIGSNTITLSGGSPTVQTNFSSGLVDSLFKSTFGSVVLNSSDPQTYTATYDPASISSLQVVVYS